MKEIERCTLLLDSKLLFSLNRALEELIYCITQRFTRKDADCTWIETFVHNQLSASSLERVS